MILVALKFLISQRRLLQTLGSLLEELDLDTTPEKASPPANSMVFLGVLVDTANMTVSVSPERVQELFDRCSSLLPVDNVSRTNLQSLLGVMSYVTACVRPARVFMSTLLYTLRVHKLSSVCPLSPDNKNDLRWWCYFLPFYNGVTIIKTVPWCNDPLSLSTDACSTGAGGFFNGQYFHKPFPSSVLHRFGHDIITLELLDGDRVAPSSHVRDTLTSFLVSSSLQPRVIPRQFVIPSRSPRSNLSPMILELTTGI